MVSERSDVSPLVSESPPGFARLAIFALVALRIGLGWVFFYSGVTKVFDPNWTASGYLTNAVPAGNPFAALWPVLANVPLIDVLVQWGMLLTGVGLIVGAMVRWNAFWASFMMLTFWASSLPLENGLLVDSHVIYIIALIGVASLGGGRIAGFDGVIESTSLVQRYPRLRYLLG